METWATVFDFSILVLFLIEDFSIFITNGDP